MISRQQQIPFSRKTNSRWDRYLGMTAVMTQVPVGYLIQCHFTFHSNLII